MKKFTFTAVVFCIAVFLFCCKTYKETIVPENEDVVYNELSDYLNSAKGAMHNAPVPQQGGTPYIVTTTEANTKTPVSFHSFEIPVANQDAIHEGDVPVMTKKQERKAIKELVKSKLQGDDDKTGIAIGILILYLLLSVLILILLIYLLVNAASNASNNSSNGSGSGSNSGNSGNSGGSGSNSGCYVATMVYGSYDAPEVMVLRRFRDEKLAHSKAGRAFIRWYYGWSPGFVEKYSHLNWLHSIIKVALNRLVKFLS